MHVAEGRPGIRYLPLTLYHRQLLLPLKQTLVPRLLQKRVSCRISKQTTFDPLHDTNLLPLGKVMHIGLLPSPLQMVLFVGDHIRKDRVS
jgi:hypothetical protein